MFIDIDYFSVKKYNQNAFGDYFISKRKPEEKRLLAVLSDGLGSGIKANILACMTANMLLRFTEEQVPLKNAAETVMNSLPICKIRKISYATFSAIDCDDDGSIRIVEEGNPQFIWLRGDKVLSPECKIIESAAFPNRKMNVYQIQAELGDRLIFCSDGVTQAGLGQKAYPLGWKRNGLINFLSDTVSKNADISSSDLAKKIKENRACFNR